MASATRTVSRGRSAPLLTDTKTAAYRAAKTRWLSRLKTRAGAVFSRTCLGEDIRRLQSLYKEHGYAFVSLRPITSINSTTRTIDFTLEISPGKLITVEQIKVVGHGKVPLPLIRTLVGLKAGDRYNAKKVEQSLRRLRQLGFFSKVWLTSRSGKTDDRIVLQINLR